MHEKPALLRQRQCVDDSDHGIDAVSIRTLTHRATTANRIVARVEIAATQFPDARFGAHMDVCAGISHRFIGKIDIQPNGVVEAGIEGPGVRLRIHELTVLPAQHLDECGIARHYFDGQTADHDAQTLHRRSHANLAIRRNQLTRRGSSTWLKTPRICPQVSGGSQCV